MPVVADQLRRSAVSLRRLTLEPGRPADVAWAEFGGTQGTDLHGTVVYARFRLDGGRRVIVELKGFATERDSGYRLGPGSALEHRGGFRHPQPVGICNVLVRSRNGCSGSFQYRFIVLDSAPQPEPELVGGSASIAGTGVDGTVTRHGSAAGQVAMLGFSPGGSWAGVDDSARASGT